MQFHAGPFLLPSEAATTALAECMAPRLGPGDCLLLSGPVGAGKSAFARALIRARTGNPAEDVPSPTFTLVQTYDAPGAVIWHADLYRLSHPDEAAELGLEEAMETAICLIEWPDRLGAIAPADGLDLQFAARPDGAHEVVLAGDGAWQKRLEGCLG